jgi:Fe-S-cluster containining protein
LTDELLPDCRVCAACCFSPQERYVELKGVDHARLSADERSRLTVFHGTLCYIKMVDGHCAALVREGSEWLCSVYERRPQLCRDYERGGPACGVDRERLGRNCS